MFKLTERSRLTIYECLIDIYGRHLFVPGCQTIFLFFPKVTIMNPFFKNHLLFEMFAWGIGLTVSELTALLYDTYPENGLDLFFSAFCLQCWRIYFQFFIYILSIGDLENPISGRSGDLNGLLSTWERVVAEKNLEKFRSIVLKMGHYYNCNYFMLPSDLENYVKQFREWHTVFWKFPNGYENLFSWFIQRVFFPPGCG